MSIVKTRGKKKTVQMSVNGETGRLNNLFFFTHFFTFGSLEIQAHVSLKRKFQFKFSLTIRKTNLHKINDANRKNITFGPGGPGGPGGPLEDTEMRKTLY